MIEYTRRAHIYTKYLSFGSTFEAVPLFLTFSVGIHGDRGRALLLMTIRVPNLSQGCHAKQSQTSIYRSS